MKHPWATAWDIKENAQDVATIGLGHIQNFLWRNEAALEIGCTQASPNRR